MSTINTNGLDVNYPIPGQNNSSQGFRTNFASIKNNLDIAGTEISDLQNKVVLKSALANSTINNDMANTLISNAATLNFRATTYNLGSALSGQVGIDTALADVQYGTVSEDITLSFYNWAPVGTERKIELQFNISNANAQINFPSAVVANADYGLTMIENYDNDGLSYVTAPYGVTQLNFTLISTDCGDTIYIEPNNRPFRATQITERTPPSTGYVGDTTGTVCMDPALDQLSVTSTADITLSGVTITGVLGTFSCTATSRPLAIGQTVKISGTLGGTGSITGYSNPTTYYIIATNGSTTFTLSTTSGAFAIPVATTAGTPTGLTYLVNNGYLTTTGNTSQLYTDLPIIFTAGPTGVTTEANLTLGTTYYVKNVSNSTSFTVSSSIGGSNVNLSGNVAVMYANPVGYVYVATDNYNSTPYEKNVSRTYSNGLITVTNTTSLANNAPVHFINFANVANNGGLDGNLVYYIKSVVDAGNITVSRTRTNGVAGTQVTLSDYNPGTTFCTACATIGNDIWKRIPLTPF